MKVSNLIEHRAFYLMCLIFLMVFVAGAVRADEKRPDMSIKMVRVEGGIFMMGDVFGEGRDNEIPVHQVQLSSFYMAPYEVTVGEFRLFVEETGYSTSAEAPNDVESRKQMMEKAASGKLSQQDIQELKTQILQYSGAGYWDAEKRQWTGYNPVTNWKNPGFKQADDHPVVAISVDDARHYCNWLSQKFGLPVAYDLKTGGLLDKDGNPTLDVLAAKGYRLPTEAEWEYAAREAGQRVRFGNGKNTARSAEINFRADDGDYKYLKLGEYRKGTTAVGTFPPNGLGLYDMSGNAWEWTGDIFTKYDNKTRVNPYNLDGDEHALRGGRWGGDAFEARVFHRSSWVRNDRCNNSGFRIARSQ